MSLGTVGMIILDLPGFLEEIRPSIKWSSSTGYHRCTGCGAQLDSTSKLSHWPKHCSLSKEKAVQKLRAQVLAENFPAEEKPAIKEAGLGWYQNQIKINENLPIDFNPTGAPINEDLYPSSLKELSSIDVQDLTDLFSGKIKCRVKQVYTHDKIIDEIPMGDDPDRDMFSCPEWLKDHNQAIEETHALGLYAESIKKGVCDLPHCFCHELAAMKNQEDKEDELA
jgi:hypothetical protein